VAIIADGNRRWARERGLPVLAGHVQGIEAIRPVVRHRDRRSDAESYTFSTENWASDDEVSGLFG
jgi:undecaprenyl diphosphate synthase